MKDEAAVGFAASRAGEEALGTETGWRTRPSPRPEPSPDFGSNLGLSTGEPRGRLGGWWDRGRRRSARRPHEGAREPSVCSATSAGPRKNRRGDPRGSPANCAS